MVEEESYKFGNGQAEFMVAVLKVGEVGQGYSSKCKVTVMKADQCSRASTHRRPKAMAMLIVSKRRKRNQSRQSGELIGEVSRQPSLYYIGSRRERLIEATKRPRRSSLLTLQKSSFNCMV